MLGIFCSLLDDLNDNTRTDSTAAFTDSEAEPFLDSDGVDQVTSISTWSPGMTISNALGQLDVAGHVGGTEVELGTVAVERRGMTAALILRQHVNPAR